MDKTFSVKEAISYGWKKFWSRWKFYVGFILATLAISWAVSILSAIFEDVAVVAAVLSIVGIVVQVLISIAIITLFVKSARDQKVSWNDLLSNKGRFLPFLGVSILYQLMVVIGFILLIVPGFYLALRYQYAYYIILDDPKISIGKAFKRSAQMTKGIKWRLLWFGIVSAGVVLLGLLALGVGMLFAVPVAALAQAFVYVQIRKKYHGDFLGEESGEASSEEKVVEAEVESEPETEDQEESE